MCQHKNLKIIERSWAETHYEFEDEKPLSSGYPTAEYNPVLVGIEVECFDCMFWHFYALEAKRPKWVRDACNKLVEEQHKHAMDINAF